MDVRLTGTSQTSLAEIYANIKETANEKDTFIDFYLYFIGRLIFFLYLYSKT